jgi:hypothetical protein
VRNSPATYTVLNTDIEPKTMSRLLDLHDLDRGVVVCHPVPPGTRASYLARDVLYALGKHPAALGWPHVRPVANRGCITWLQAEQVTDLLLLRADLFSCASLADLVGLASGAGAHSWLLFDSARHCRRATEGLQASPAAGVRITPRNKTPSKRPVDRARRWATPSPWIARAAATRVFTVDQLNSVDARMHTAFKNTGAWLSEQRELQPGSTERFLGALTSDPVTHHRHARRIGAASALLLHGLAAEIRSRHQRPAVVVCEPSCVQAGEIRRYSNPARAAAHALAILTDLDAKTLTRLTLDQLIEEPDGVRLGGYLLLGAGAAALRAHAADQAARGHPPTAPLFTNRQLANRDPVGESNRAVPRRLDVRLQALQGSLDITYHQPQVGSGFTAPARNHHHEAALILRLLRLNVSRELPLARFRKAEREAAQRLATVGAIHVHEGAVAATKHLRFSYFIGDTATYLASAGERFP